MKDYYKCIIEFESKFVSKIIYFEFKMVQKSKINTFQKSFLNCKNYIQVTLKYG